MLAYLKLAAVSAVLAGAFGGGWQVRDWQADAADLARLQAEQRTALRRQEAATGAARTYEEQRDAIRRDLLASMPRVAPALAAPVAQGCPALGDVRVPADALGRLRAAAGEFGADSDSAEPRPAVLPGASAPGQ